MLTFDRTKLACASNDAGKGDLNCLAHVLVAYFRKKEKSLENSHYRLYRAYLLKNGLTPDNLSEGAFWDKIADFNAVEVEKEITPLLEDMLNTISGTGNKSRLKKLVELANSLGLNIQVHVNKRNGQKDDMVARLYDINYMPSKQLSQTELPTLQAAIGKGTIDVASTLGIKQTGLENAPKIKLFLEDPNNRSVDCNCHFEYPVDHKDGGEALELHNVCIQDERERRQVKSSKSGVEQPLSFMDSIGKFVSMFGGIFAKFMQVLLGTAQQFQHAFGGEPSGHKKTSSGVDGLFSGAPGASSADLRSRGTFDSSSSRFNEFETKEKRDVPASSSSSSSSEPLLYQFKRGSRGSDGPSTGKGPDLSAPGSNRSKIRPKPRSRSFSGNATS